MAEQISFVCDVLVFPLLSIESQDGTFNKSVRCKTWEFNLLSWGYSYSSIAASCGWGGIVEIFGWEIAYSILLFDLGTYGPESIPREHIFGEFLNTVDPACNNFEYSRIFL